MSVSSQHHSYWVYILTNQRNGTLYVGVTNSLKRRLWQHKTNAIEGFSKRHRLKFLVCYEEFRDVNRAIAREKEIKGWLRVKKLALIEATNPTWQDLGADWFDLPLDSSLHSE
jgi:putative endonuclease